MRRAGGDAAGEAGFTLVEVLVALTVLGLLTAMLFGGLRFGARTWERVTSHSQARDRVVAAQQFLHRQLGDVSVPSGLLRRDRATGLPFRGTPEALSFVAPWRAGASHSGLYVFTLRGVDGRLLLDWRRVGSAAGADAGDDVRGQRALVEGVRTIRFAYYGAADETEAAAWHATWNTGLGPPRLVSLALDLTEGHGTWPVLVVATGQ